MLGLEMFVRKQSKLEPALIQLVKMRASQINGCAAFDHIPLGAR
jgi:alkylhydroperoxidase family enzyme